MKTKQLKSKLQYNYMNKGVKMEMKCICGNTDFHVYKNNGNEYICKRCRGQFIISKNGNVIWL